MDRDSEANRGQKFVKWNEIQSKPTVHFGDLTSFSVHFLANCKFFCHNRNFTNCALWQFHKFFRTFFLFAKIIFKLHITINVK